MSIKNEAIATPATTQTTTRRTPGFSIIPSEMLNDPIFMKGVNHTGRVMLIYLQVSNGGTKDIFLSNKTLMKKTFIADEQSVVRAKNRLKKDGLIFETGRTVGRGIKVLRLKTYPKQTKKPRTNQPTEPRTNQPTEPRTNQSTEPRTNQSTDPLTNQSTDPLTNQSFNPLQIGSHKRTKEEIHKTTTAKPVKPARIIHNASENGVVVSSVEISIQTNQTKANNEPIHPTISNQNQTIINRLLAKVSKDQAKELIDELKARLDGEGDSIRNPIGFIVALIKSVKNGTWALSAARIREDNQEARDQAIKKQKASQKAEKQAEEEEKKSVAVLDKAKSKITKENMEKLRVKFIEQLRKTGSLTFLRFKADNFQSIGFKFLFNGFLRETLLE